MGSHGYPLGRYRYPLGRPPYEHPVVERRQDQGRVPRAVEAPEPLQIQEDGGLLVASRDAWIDCATRARPPRCRSPASS